MMSMGAVSESLLVVNFLCLREPGACGFPPAVVEIEEQVVEMFVGVANGFHLVKVSGDVAHLVQVLGSYLTDVQVDKVAVVGIDLIKLVASEVLSIKPVSDVNMLVGKCNGGVAVVVAWSLNVLKGKIGFHLVLIDLEVEV
jgi:hypothetical protein